MIEEDQENQLSNTFYTVIYLLSLGLILGLTGYLLAGAEGLLWMAVLGLVTFGFHLWSPAQLRLRIYGARKLSYHESPELYDILDELSQKAGLLRRPELYWMPSQSWNAFAVGSKEYPVVGITQGILQILNWRELRGVLAHEISHLKNNDTRLMLIAQLMSRMTANLSFLGKVLLFLNLPLILVGEVYISWMAILLLLGAPYLSHLLSLALSRTREFEADLGAAELTQDPESLALALEKLEYYQQKAYPFWWGKGRPLEIPGIWRSHPITEKRIEKLRALVKKYKPLSSYLRPYWV